MSNSHQARAISVAKLSGQDLDFSASGNLSADDVTATGNVKLASSAGDIIATDKSTSIQAGGALMLTAGGDIRLGAVRSSARDTPNNATTMIEALDGVIVIESLAAAGPVTATAHNITIRGSGDLFFQQLKPMTAISMSEAMALLRSSLVTLPAMSHSHQARELSPS